MKFQMITYYDDIFKIIWKLTGGLLIEEPFINYHDDDYDYTLIDKFRLTIFEDGFSAKKERITMLIVVDTNMINAKYMKFNFTNAGLSSRSPHFGSGNAKSLIIREMPSAKPIIMP